MNYVHDDLVIIGLQGLRWVVKKTAYWVSEQKEKYELELQYKGSARTVVYESKALRDAMFDALAKYLKAEQP